MSHAGATGLVTARSGATLAAGPDSGTVARHFVLHVGLLLAVLYPLKGLLSGVLYLTFGEQGFAATINPRVAVVLAVFVAVSFAIHARWSHLGPTEVWLFWVGLALLAVSLARQNFAYSMVVGLTLMLPLALTHMAYASDGLFRRAVWLFFCITVFYVAVEHVVLHTHLYGITEDIWIDGRDLIGYYKGLGADPNIGDETGSVIDFRHTTLYGMAGRVRTGGFLAHPLQMPTLISMAATFFYVRWRLIGGAPRVVMLGAALFGLVNSLSTTAVLAFGLAVLFYELYSRGDARKYLSVVVLMAAFVAAALYVPAIVYLVARFVDSMEHMLVVFLFNPRSFHDWVLTLVGLHGWLRGWNHLYSENDLINVASAFGLILAFFVFRRLLQPALQARKFNDPELTTYAIVGLNAVLCMMHREAVITPNVFILVNLLTAKSQRMIREHEQAAL